MVKELAGKMVNVKVEQDYMEVRDRVHRNSKFPFSGAFHFIKRFILTSFFFSQREYKLKNFNVVRIRSIHPHSNDCRSSFLSEEIF